MNIKEVFFPFEFELDFDHHFRHIDRYLKSVKLLGKLGKTERWLDISCGSGYGTGILSLFCKMALGSDVNEKNIRYAEAMHGSSSCSFASMRGLPMCDVIFSIETIEHIGANEIDEFIKRICLILKCGGSLVVCTPIVPETNKNPSNPHHKIEYSLDDVIDLFGSHGFDTVRFLLDKIKNTNGESAKQGYLLFRRK